MLLHGIVSTVFSGLLKALCCWRAIPHGERKLRVRAMRRCTVCRAYLKLYIYGRFQLLCHTAFCYQQRRYGPACRLHEITEVVKKKTLLLFACQCCLTPLVGMLLYSSVSELCNLWIGTGLGVTCFLICELFTQLPTSFPDFSSFESSSITFQLPRSKISVYSVYSHQSSSTLSKRNAGFLEVFHSFLSIAATTPHEFIITGDFNIHLDNPTDHLTSQFRSLLSSLINLIQHVNFPTHNKRHILDLVITSSDCSLAPSISFSYCSPSDHFHHTLYQCFTSSCSNTSFI